MLETGYIDPRVIKTRESLAQAFSALMAEKTFKKITVADLTKHARVNRATFYAHFDNKEELLAYSLREMFTARMARWLPETPALTYETLNTLTLGLFEFLAEFLGGCHPGTEKDMPALPLLHEQVQPALRDILKDWLEACGTRAQANIDTQADILSWAIFGSALRWANDRDRAPAEEAVDLLVTTLLRTQEPALVR